MAIISISDSQVNSANQILVADSNSKIPAKDGSQITILNATNVSSGTIASARLDTGTTAGKLVVLDGSGNLPAVNASLLTGVVSATISASDPTISTNPSSGVGTEWNNSTSGAMYILTDATAGENKWTNVGAGSGNIDPWSYPKSTYGYMMGGNYPSAPTLLNSIERFSTVSDANAVDWADMIYGRSYPPAGQRSIDYGYCCGGSSPSQPGFDGIDKWPFASQTNATDVGNLSRGRGGTTGASSGTYVYTVGGHYGPYSNEIDKVSVATDGNAVDVGDITNYHAQGYSHSSADNGYNSGGYAGSPSPTGHVNVMHKWSFTTDGNATDIGDLTLAREGRISSSSTTYAYCGWGAGGTDRIDKFPFASDANATDVGNALIAGYGTGGCASSLNYGYAFSGSNTNHIHKWSHTTDGNAVDVADVAQLRGQCAGTHG